MNWINDAKFTLCLSKLKNTQNKLFIDETSFQGLTLVLDSHRTPFQAPAVVNENVIIQPALGALFHYTNILVKALHSNLHSSSENSPIVTRVGGKSSVTL